MLGWVALYTCLFDMTLGKVLVNLEVLSFHPEYFSLQYYSVPGDVVIGAGGFVFSLVLFRKAVKFEFDKLEREIETERLSHVVLAK
jgi:hypothetical protein